MLPRRRLVGPDLDPIQGPQIHSAEILVMTGVIAVPFPVVGAGMGTVAFPVVSTVAGAVALPVAGAVAGAVLLPVVDSVVFGMGAVPGGSVSFPIEGATRPLRVRHNGQMQTLLFLLQAWPTPFCYSSIIIRHSPGKSKHYMEVL